MTTRVLDALPFGVLVVDEHGQVREANAGAVLILRRSKEALVSVDVGLVLQPIDSLRKLAEASDDERSTVTTRLASGRDIRIRYTVDILESEGTRQYVVAFRDVSEELAVQAERDRLLRLAGVNEVLPTLLQGLNNPLAAMSIALEVLLEEIEDATLRPRLHAILVLARRMALTLKGVDCTGRPIHAEQYGAIDFACRETFLVLSARAREAGVHARCDVHDMPLLLLEPSVIKSIVFNLLSNAIDACSEGDTVVIHGRLLAGGRWLEITVADTGRGMSAEEYDRCTELFFTTRRQGSGVGLAQCKRAIDAAGGELGIKSVLGAGTTVTVRIPTQPRIQQDTTESGGIADVTNR